MHAFYCKKALQVFNVVFKNILHNRLQSSINLGMNFRNGCVNQCYVVVSLSLLFVPNVAYVVISGCL